MQLLIYRCNRRIPTIRKRISDAYKNLPIDHICLVSTGATTGYDSKLDLKYLFFRGT
jgi:hypothetical protein